MVAFFWFYWECLLIAHVCTPHHGESVLLLGSYYSLCRWNIERLKVLPEVTQLINAELRFEPQPQSDSWAIHSCCLPVPAPPIVFLKSLWFKRQFVIKSQSGVEVLKALPALSGIKHFVRSNNSIIIANVSTFTVTIAPRSRL